MTIPQCFTWRFEVMKALLLLGGGCGANRVAVRPAPAGGGADFLTSDVREILELAAFVSFGVFFRRTFFGHGLRRCSTIVVEGGGHLGGPRGRGISRRKVRTPSQWGQVKGSGGARWGGIS